MLLVLVFSVPKVQSWAAVKATSYVNKKYATDISVKALSIGFSGSVDINGVLIKDHHLDTLIRAEQVSTSILNFKDLIEGDGHLTNAYLTDGQVDMKVYEGETLDNLRHFTNLFISKNSKKKKVIIDIEDVKIKEVNYTFINENTKPEPIVDIKNINFEGEDLIIDGARIELQSNSLAFVYNNGINVTNLQTQMYLNTGVMSFKNIRLQSDKKSNVAGDLDFYYNKGDLSDFNNKVVLKAGITTSKISTTDLQTFYNKFGRGKLIDIKTRMDGTMNDFKLTNLRLSGLTNSAITGDLRLQNSMSKDLINDFKISGAVSKLQSTKDDLVDLLPLLLRNRLPKELSRLGTVNILGDIEATPTSVNLDGNVYTDLGIANMLLTMKDFNSTKNATYVGNVNVFDFDLGKFTENKYLGRTSFDLDVDGKGFFLKDSDTYIQGNFSAFQFKGYTYRDISVKGTIKDPVFDGEVIANDPNFNLTFNGLVNINEEENDYDFSAQVTKIDFNKLNIFKRDSISNFKGNIVAQLKGTSVDDAYGDISFKNTQYVNQNDTYDFKDFKISSSFNEEQERTLRVNSPDILNGIVTGKFKFKNIGNLFQNSFASLYKNYEPEVYTDFEYINFDLKIYNKIVDVFFPNVSFGANTFIKGSVASDESKFKFDFQSPKINLNKNSIDNIVFQIDNTNPLYNAYITVDKLNSERYPISNFSLLNVSINDTLYMRTEFKGGLKKTDDYDFNVFHTINEKSNSIVGIQKSIARIKGNKWYVNEKDDDKHLLEFSDRFSSVKVDSIKINHQNERIVFGGVIRDTSYKDFKVNFSKVNLENISPSIKNLSYEGLIDGDLSILQKNGAYYPESNITITDFILNDLLLGELVMNVVGSQDLTQYVVNSKLLSGLREVVALKGKIDVKKSEPQIDLEVSFNEFRLKPFSALGGVVISNLRGEVNGKALLKGNYKNPDVSGELFLNKAGLRFPYLNVDLNIEENSKLTLSKKEIRFNNTLLTDSKFSTKGYLNGAISHSNFKNWNLDLLLESDRLLVLNTNEADNDLYYGTAFIDGEATIKGPTDKLKISVVAASSEGTKFKIPLSDAESVGDNSFVHFTTPQEKQAKQLGGRVYFEDVKGVELAFELDLNKYAEVEVVIDPTSGSTLKGYGAGTLLIEINTNGKFNMWGDFVAYKGTYDFKYGGILSKRFDVLSGGSINWNGSPTGAILNLSAVYKTKANPAILLENSAINRKLDVEVVTTLQGELLKPDLSFDIEFPTTSSVVKSELDYLLSDRTTKERQALSLVTQGQFYSDALIGDSVITGNLVERASSLVNSIFSDEEDKFKIGLDYVQGDNTEDQEISDRFGVSVTTQISNRILINGKVGVPVGGVSESVVVGDVRIDFLLNEDGSLRATIFNKQNDIQFIGEADGYTQGVGLSYSYDFDNFKDLLKKIFISQKNKKG